MRLNKNTGVFLAVLLVVIVGALFVLNNPTSAPDLAGSTGETLDIFGGKLVTDINSLRITENATNLSATFTQDTTGAWVQAEVDAPVRQFDLDGAIGDLLQVKASDSFPASDLAPYGLDAPAYTVTLGGRGVAVTLHVGNSNPAGTRIYALLGDDTETVYLMNGVSQLARVTAFVLNPPIVVITPTAGPVLNTAGIVFAGFSPEDIAKLTLIDHENEAQLTLFRDTTGRWFVDPFSTNAQTASTDSLLVDAMLFTMQFLSAVDVLSGVDAGAVGLTNPRYELRAERADGFAYTLAVGALDVSGARYYARAFDLDNVAVIPRDDIDALVRFIGNPPYEQANAEATEPPTEE